jgi:dihydrofolate reductase
MRKLIVTNISSIDGYYEGPGANVIALPMDHGFDAYNAERLGSADTLLLGRRTYELLKSFWPPVADDPEAKLRVLDMRSFEGSENLLVRYATEASRR